MTSHYECTMHKITKEGSTLFDISLDEIAREEREGKSLLGKADGQGIGHCVYLGVSYCKGFFEKAKWYHLSTETDARLEELQKKQPGTIRVEFYGEKKHE